MIITLSNQITYLALKTKMERLYINWRQSAKDINGNDNIFLYAMTPTTVLTGQETFMKTKLLKSR